MTNRTWAKLIKSAHKQASEDGKEKYFIDDGLDHFHVFVHLLHQRCPHSSGSVSMRLAGHQWPQESGELDECYAID